MKEKKILKKSDKCYAVAMAGVGTMLLSLLPFMVCITYVFKENKVLKNAGYYDFNEQYKEECLAELSDDYQNGKIKLEDFMAKSQNLEDYSVEKYIDEYASVGDKNEFDQIRETTNVLTTIGVIGESIAMPVAIAGATAFVITAPKERNERCNSAENEEEKEKGK